MRRLHFAFLPEELYPTNWRERPLHLWRLRDHFEVQKKQCMNRHKHYSKPYWQEISLSSKAPEWITEGEYKVRFEPLYLGVSELVRYYKLENFYGLEKERMGIRVRVRLLFTPEQEAHMDTPDLIKYLYEQEDFYPKPCYLSFEEAYRHAAKRLPECIDQEIEVLRQKVVMLKKQEAEEGVSYLQERRQISSVIGSYCKWQGEGVSEAWVRSAAYYLIRGSHGII